MVSLLVLWPYQISGIILSISFILSILLVLLPVIFSFCLFLVIFSYILSQEVLVFHSYSCFSYYFIHFILFHSRLLVISSVEIYIFLIQGEEETWSRGKEEERYHRKAPYAQ